jgi:hypothetical protein
MSDIVLSGVAATGITVGNSEDWTIHGAAVSFTTGDGGSATVFSGGIAISTLVAGGVESISGCLLR